MSGPRRGCLPPQVGQITRSRPARGRTAEVECTAICPQAGWSARQLPTSTRTRALCPDLVGRLGRVKLAVISRTSALLLLGTGIWYSLPADTSAAAAWVAPLPEPLAVTRPFEPPENPYGPGHRGADLAGSPGQQVRASGAGTVVYAGPLAGRGVISVQHADELRTTYEPVLAAVAAGMSVSLGQVLGSLETGHAGCPVSACLHWGLKRGEVYLDPLLLLSQGPVRLLPRYGAGAAGSALDPVLVMTSVPLVLGVLGALPLTCGARRRSGRFSRFRRVDGLGGRPP